MKKLIYLFSAILLSINTAAQINPNDRNWRHVLNENFDEGSSYWQWNYFSNPSQTWRAYPGSGVTHGNEHQVYQPSQCRIDTVNQHMKLVAEYDSEGRIPEHDYILPSWMIEHGLGYPTYPELYYFSGTINYINRNIGVGGGDRSVFRYGYFEIRCQLPIHRGAFPAFWLYAAATDSTDRFYEEIDIFEYTWAYGDPMAPWINNPNPTYPGDPNVFSTGIYHNLIGPSSDLSPYSYARNYPRVPQGSSNLNGWHVFACEWMPDHVYWYFDGNLVNSYTSPEHIPRHPLILKANYAIDLYYKNNNDASTSHHNSDLMWQGSDVMTIDYINVYQLRWDCQNDETITSQADLDSFDYAVKKSISISSTTDMPIVSSNDDLTFRVTDYFEITGEFEVQHGAEFGVITQTCPNDN